MAHDTTWSQLALEPLTNRLADPALAGGGNRGSAALAALGAALGGAALRGTSGDAGTWAVGRADELDALRGRALELLDGIDAGIERAALARALPEDDESRAGALRKAENRSVELPLEVMELVVASLRILAVGAPELEPASAPICASSAAMLGAALEVALPEVVTALAAAGPERNTQHRMATDALRAEAAALLDEVRRETEHRAA